MCTYFIKLVWCNHKNKQCVHHVDDQCYVAVSIYVYKVTNVHAGIACV
jgi:hypothetical protein